MSGIASRARRSLAIPRDALPSGRFDRYGRNAAAANFGGGGTRHKA